MKLNKYLIIFAMVLILLPSTFAVDINKICYTFADGTSCFGTNITGAKINASDVLNPPWGSSSSSSGSADGNNNVTNIIFENGTTTTMTLIQDNRPNIVASFLNPDNSNTSEQMQDAVINAFINTTTITYRYDDSGNLVNWSVNITYFDTIYLRSFTESDPVFSLQNNSLWANITKINLTEYYDNLTQSNQINGLTNALANLNSSWIGVYYGSNQTYNDTLAVLGNASIKVNLTQFVGVFFGNNQTYNDTLAVLGNASIKVNLSQLVGVYYGSNQTYNETTAVLGNASIKANISQLSDYYLDSNPDSFITDGNTLWDNIYGLITNTVSDLVNYYTRVQTEALGNLTYYYNKTSADYNLSTKFNTTGGKMSGDLNMTNNDIYSADTIYANIICKPNTDCSKRIVILNDSTGSMEIYT